MIVHQAFRQLHASRLARRFSSTLCSDFHGLGDTSIFLPSGRLRARIYAEDGFAKRGHDFTAIADATRRARWLLDFLRALGCHIRAAVFEKLVITSLTRR